ncbi:MAG: ABC transporter ATP-binding protein [Thermoanaerobaculia bacterium]|nr:ABC transporter ATP-binding protein [Thermoanaerobaculia bacterium]
MLKIDNLEKTYPGNVRALQGVSLDIAPGLFGLLGPNGSGKSTLMRTLATLQSPDRGTVTFAGRDIFQHAQTHRRLLGYLPQEFGVYPGVSAERLLDHLAVLKGLTHVRQRREQIHALLEKTNLYPVRKKAVSTFSGGMRRRFGIAQALLGDPRLIIVDEPTAGLDPEERHRFHDLLAAVGERVVVVLSTHIVEDIRRLCSRMAVLHEGRVQAIGEPERLVRVLDGKIWQRTVPRGELGAFRERFQVLSTQLLAGRTQIRVLADDCPDPGFAPFSPSLEDVYFSALGQNPAA